MSPIESVSDEDLVARFVAGDESAFATLVERYQRRVFGICYRYFGDAATAEDAAQDAFLALYRRASTFKGDAKFSTWMYRVTTNACNDLARKASRRPQAADTQPDALADELLAEDVIARRDLRLELRQALEQLDEPYRTAVILHTVGGYTHAEVAERTDVAVGTVKSRVHRGHARLAALLRDEREPSGRSPPPTG